MAGSLTRSRDDDELAENHEINVTPFIDVMLVLLIIFMVAAPLATVDVNVDLPASTARPQPHPDKPVFITIEPDLGLSLGEEEVARPQLAAMLDRETGGKRDTRIFLRADKVVAYGDLMDVMNVLRDAGYTKIALVGLETVPDTGSDAAERPAVAAPAGDAHP